MLIDRDLVDSVLGVMRLGNPREQIRVSCHGELLWKDGKSVRWMMRGAQVSPFHWLHCCWLHPRIGRLTIARLHPSTSSHHSIMKQ